MQVVIVVLFLVRDLGLSAGLVGLVIALARVAGIVGATIGVQIQIAMPIRSHPRTPLLSSLSLHQIGRTAHPQQTHPEAGVRGRCQGMDQHGR
jgi:hypothetical protein